VLAAVKIISIHNNNLGQQFQNACTVIKISSLWLPKFSLEE